MNGLTPAARQRAREIAEAAPPLSPDLRRRLRSILWGVTASAPRTAETASAQDEAASCINRDDHAA